MLKHRLLRITIISFSCLLFLSCSENGEKRGAASFPDQLPAEAPGGWRVSDSPRLFKGDDLFLYMNGGAEIYHEYGFERVLVREYKNSGGRTIILEVFEMSDAESAFGIYTFKTGHNGEDIRAGNAGLMENYYINFWKGNFLITLTGLDDSPETVDGLKRMARSMDQLIETGGDVPELAGALPAEGLVRKSMKYISGTLGLRNIDSFLSGKVSSFEQAVRGDYENRIRITIFRYADERHGQAQFQQVGRRLDEDATVKELTRTDSTISAFTEDDSLLACRSYKEFIIFAAGPVSPREADDMLQRVKENLTESAKP